MSQDCKNDIFSRCFLSKVLKLGGNFVLNELSRIMVSYVGQQDRKRATQDCRTK